MKYLIKLSAFAILMIVVSSCAIHTGVMNYSAQLSQANFTYVKKGLYGTCQTTKCSVSADVVEFNQN